MKNLSKNMKKLLAFVILLLLFSTSFSLPLVYHIFPNEIVFNGTHTLPENQLPINISVEGYIYNPNDVYVGVNDILKVYGNIYTENGGQIYMGGYLVATQNWVNSQGFLTEHLPNSSYYLDQLSHSTTDYLIEGATNLYYTNERVDDRVAMLIKNGTGINWIYNDVSNELTPNIFLTPFTTDNLTEGATNLYWTQARFDTAFSSKTTDDLTEGATNKYYSSTLFDNDFSTKTTDDLSEGSLNLYWTQSRFDTAFAGKTTDDLAEGTTNKYYSSSLFDSDFNSKITSNVNVTGVWNFYSGINPVQNLDIGGGFGDADGGATITSTGDLYLDGDLVYSGNTYVSEAQAINGSSIPFDNDVFDLGNSTHNWRNLYLSGNIYLGDTSTVNGDVTLTGNLEVQGTGTSSFAGDVSVSGEISATKIGIGTSTPSTPLDIRNGNINIEHTMPYLRMSDTDTTAEWKHKYLLGYDGYFGFDFYNGTNWQMTVKVYPDHLNVGSTNIYSTSASFTGDITVGGDIKLEGNEIKDSDNNILIGSYSGITGISDGLFGIRYGEGLDNAGIFFSGTGASGHPYIRWNNANQRFELYSSYSSSFAPLKVKSVEADDFTSHGKIYLSHGLVMTYKTPGTGSSYVNYWSKIASITITGQYDSRDALIWIMGDGGGGTTTEPHALIYFRVKQQNAMGDPPHVQVDYIYGRDITPDNIKAVVTQNDASATVVELYLQATESYSTFYYTQLGEGTVTLHNAQSWQSSLPSGTVINAQRIDYYMEDLDLTGNAVIGGGTITLKNGYISDSTSTTYTHIKPQNNMLVLYDPSGGDPRLRLYHGGGEYLELKKSSTDAYILTNADGITLDPYSGVLTVDGYVRFNNKLVAHDVRDSDITWFVGGSGETRMDINPRVSDTANQDANIIIGRSTDARTLNVVIDRPDASGSNIFKFSIPKTGTATFTSNGDIDLNGNIDVSGDLTVSGGITISSQTRYYSLSPHDFVARQETEDFYRYPAKVKVTTSGTQFFAPVHLPHGAVVTEVKIYGSDSSETWGLYRVGRDGVTYSTMASANLNSADTSISYATIDNYNYAYHIIVSALESGEEIDGGYIKYTITNPYP